MAEIKVEKRNKAPIWPWIIGILILLALIWLLMEAFSDDSDEFERQENELPQEVEGHVGEKFQTQTHTLLLTRFENT